MFVIFFFKQKTAYEMRISDWSSDVCSSDLAHAFSRQRGSAGADLIFNALADICIDVLPILEGAAQHRLTNTAKQAAGNLVDQSLAIGSASCRERGCQSV